MKSALFHVHCKYLMFQRSWSLRPLTLELWLGYKWEPYFAKLREQVMKWVNVFSLALRVIKLLYLENIPRHLYFQFSVNKSATRIWPGEKDQLRDYQKATFFIIWAPFVLLFYSFFGGEKLDLYEMKNHSPFLSLKALARVAKNVWQHFSVFFYQRSYSKTCSVLYFRWPFFAFNVNCSNP